MWGLKNNHHQKVDRLIGALFAAYRASSEEEVSASPYLHRRIMARIEAEKRRRSEEGSAWGMLFLEAKHVIPVLTMIAVAAIGLAIYSPSLNNSPTMGSQGAASQVLVASDIPPFSNDEMMASAIDADDRQK